MPRIEGMRWFKKQFGDQVNAAIADTPFGINLITAIAVQESYDDAWGLIYRDEPVQQVLTRCVGDTLDSPRRDSKAFRKNRNDLEHHETDGKRMFGIARAALEDLASFSKGYRSSLKNPNKFCHAFGIFQYDIQFFDGDKQFFLKSQWSDFGRCLHFCMKELEKSAAHLYPGKAKLTPQEQTYVAIGYNIGPGRVKKNGTFNQGHVSDGRSYGQNIWDYINLASKV
jgi:hypothetical protein